MMLCCAIKSVSSDVESRPEVVSDSRYIFMYFAFILISMRILAL